MARRFGHGTRRRNDCVEWHARARRQTRDTTLIEFAQTPLLAALLVVGAFTIDTLKVRTHEFLLQAAVKIKAMS
jgi:hypothetical protein